MLQTDEDGKVTDVQAIDHGACFGHDMMGMKSAPLREMSRAGTKFKLSDEKLQKLSTTSFGDLRRAMPGKKDWQVGQAMLRMRYVQHLHETEGHIDSNHFGTDAFFANGKNDDGEVGPRFARMRTEGKTLFAWQQGFNEDKERRKLAHQKFEDFALDYVDSAAMDESHPDHHAAKMLAKDGVLMGPGAAENPAKHRKEGKHKDYEKTVRQHRAELAEKKEVGLQATVAPPRRTKQAAEDVGLRSALRAPKVPKGV